MTAATLESVWKHYGDYPALAGVTLKLEAGACLALVGRNGAGKTTLLRVLAGLLKPSRGRVAVGGLDPREPASRRRIGLLGHGVGLYEEFSARENLKLFAKIYGLPDPAAAAEEWLERTDLKPVGGAIVRELSRGMRQRLALARAFLHKPDLLLLDEPFTALDDKAAERLQGILAEFRSQGLTVVLSTHQLREAMELATEAALIVRGRLAFSGPRTAGMLEDPSWLYRNYGGG